MISVEMRDKDLHGTVELQARLQVSALGSLSAVEEADLTIKLNCGAR